MGPAKKNTKLGTKRRQTENLPGGKNHGPRQVKHLENWRFAAGKKKVKNELSILVEQKGLWDNELNEKRKRGGEVPSNTMRGKQCGGTNKNHAAAPCFFGENNATPETEKSGRGKHKALSGNTTPKSQERGNGEGGEKEPERRTEKGRKQKKNRAISESDA